MHFSAETADLVRIGVFRPKSDPQKKKSYRPLLNYEGGKEVRVESGGQKNPVWHVFWKKCKKTRKIQKKVEIGVISGPLNIFP